MHSCRALEIKMSILQANINGWLINQENELLVRAQLVKFLHICKLDGVWGRVWFFTVLPWKSGSCSSAERILSDLFPATPATCSTNEKTLYCCKSNKSHIWYSGAVPPALCSNHWVCKLNVQQLPLLDSGGRNPPMHLCDSPPDTVGVHHCTLGCEKRRITNIQNTLHYSFPHRYKESLRVWAANVSWAHLHVHKSSGLDQDQAIGGQQSQRQPAAADTSFSFDLLGDEQCGDEQAGNINKEKRLPKQKKRQKETANWDESTAAWGNKSSLCSNNRIITRENRSLNIVLLENAKLCILKYYEDFKRIKYYLQQRSTVYNLIFPPFLFLLHPEKSPSGNHPPCCREVWRLVNFSDGRTLKAWFPLCVLPLSLSFYLCICGEWTGKPHEGKRGSCPWLCLEVKEKN